MPNREQVRQQKKCDCDEGNQNREQHMLQANRRPRGQDESSAADMRPGKPRCQEHDGRLKGVMSRVTEKCADYVGYKARKTEEGCHWVSF